MTPTLAREANAPTIFFFLASLPERKDRPRFFVPQPGGGFAPITWGELATGCEKLASFLLDRGVTKGSAVAVCANTRWEWAAAAIALMAAQGALVPVYPTLPPSQLAHILGHSEASVLFVENAEQLARVLSVWDRLRVRTIITMTDIDVRPLAQQCGLDSDRLAAMTFGWQQATAQGGDSLAKAPSRVEQARERIELEDVAYLVYTSGTTGLPKGVPLTHLNVGVSGADWMACNGSLVKDGDVDILWLPMAHLYGLGQFFLGNNAGFVSYFADPARALALMMEQRPHVFMSVPIFWEKLMLFARAASPEPAAQYEKLRAITGGRLRFCLSGGAGLAKEVKEFFYRAGILIIEGYGLTECSPNLTMNRHDDFDFDTVGKPVPSVELKIAADGEIVAKGANIFKGYYRDPEATRAVFDADGWFHTGDLGAFTANGFVKIIGRKKDILVTAGGKNVPPANIEIKFKDFPLITQAMVYGDGKKYLTALIDIDDGVARAQLAAANADVGRSVRDNQTVVAWVQAAVDAVNRDLASYETIKKFVIAPAPLSVEDNLLTPTLKLKRAAVTKRYQRELEQLYQQAKE
ncbi:MAG: long-chain fatty acid--CoA ligase [Deltaproteobacteria bacterium]|nr:long-chain fatty acid--CoA ligase [Deltaproteobacteria bacterium]